jgi:hypothetical protein
MFVVLWVGWCDYQIRLSLISCTPVGAAASFAVKLPNLVSYLQAIIMLPLPRYPQGCYAVKFSR